MQFIVAQDRPVGFISTAYGGGVILSTLLEKDPTNELPYPLHVCLFTSGDGGSRAGAAAAGADGGDGEELSIRSGPVPERGDPLSEQQPVGARLRAHVCRKDCRRTVSVFAKCRQFSFIIVKVESFSKPKCSTKIRPV